MGQAFGLASRKKWPSVETGTVTAKANFPCEKVERSWKASSLYEEEEDAPLQVIICNSAGRTESIGSSDSKENTIYGNEKCGCMVTAAFPLCYAAIS